MRSKSSLSVGVRVALGILGIGIVGAADAQVAAPDAGSILRETDPSQRALPPAATPIAPTPSQTSHTRDGVTVAIKAVRITGTTRYSDAQLQPLVADLIGRDVDFVELRRAADKITQRYRADGWFVRAYLPEQSLEDGVLTIAVIEAHVGSVRIEAPEAGALVHDETIRRMLLVRQDKGGALAIDGLERAALLIDDLPGISAAVVLAPGARAGESDIVARVQNSSRWLVYTEVDNSGIESTGRERATAQVLFESPFKRGDEIGALLNASEGNQFARLNYELPVGADGWRVGVAASALQYELGGDFKALDAHGRATTWSIDASYPIVRSNQLNARFTSALEERRYENFAFDLSTSNSSVRAARSGLSVDRLDGFAGGGLMLFGAQLTFGALDLSRNAQDFAIDEATVHSDGDYFKASWNLGRLQRIGDRDRLAVRVNGQTVSRNLDSSEQMSLGGASGVRAYPELEAAGDEGWIATAEWTHTFAQAWSAALFYDAGAIWQHKRTWTDWQGGNLTLRNQYTLDGAGMTVAWSGLSGLEVRTTLATRFGDNPARDEAGNDNDGSLHEPQLWLNARWRM